VVATPDKSVAPLSEQEAVDVSVVIPCLDEAATIREVIGRARTALDQLGRTYEIVVADNGSSDGSQDLAREAGARVISAGPRLGYGVAVVAGARAAHGKTLVFVDADGEHDVGEIGRLLEAVDRGAALVVGSRYKGKFLPGANPFVNRFIGTPALTWLLNHYIGASVTDCNSGFRAIPKEAFQRLQPRSAGFEMCTEMIVRAALLELPIVEVPITQHPAPVGRTPHLRRFRDGWRHLKFILLHAPDRVLLRPGIASLAIGLFFFLPQIGGRFQVGPIALDIHLMILGVLMMFIGFEMIGSAIVCATIAGEPVAPPGRLSRRLGRIFTLDKTLPVALLLFLVGLLGDAMVVRISAESGFRFVLEPRLALVGTAGMGLAVQLAVLSFVHSVVESQKSEPP
jgi:hypothetical protein